MLPARFSVECWTLVPLIRAWSRRPSRPWVRPVTCTPDRLSYVRYGSRQGSRSSASRRSSSAHRARPLRHRDRHPRTSSFAHHAPQHKHIFFDVTRSRRATSRPTRDMRHRRARPSSRTSSTRSTAPITHPQSYYSTQAHHRVREERRRVPLRRQRLPHS